MRVVASPVVAPPSFGVGDQAEVDHAGDEPVERSQFQSNGSAGLLGHPLHHTVAVELAFEQDHEDVKIRRLKRQDVTRSVVRLGHESQTDISKIHRVKY